MSPYAIGMAVIAVFLIIVFVVRRKTAVATPQGGVTVVDHPATVPLPSGSATTATVATADTTPIVTAATPVPAPATPLTQIIRIVKDTTNATPNASDSGWRVLHIGEVYAYSGDRQLTASDYTSASMSGSYDPNAYQASNAIDNVPGTFAHTGPVNSPIQYLDLTLKVPTNITKVSVLNRQDCCFARLNGANVILMSGDGTVIAKKALTGAREVQVFGIP